MTEGFRGIYPVGEQARPYGTAIFDVMYDKPRAAGAAEPDRRGARSASISAATCCAPLDEAALRETVRELAAHELESIAVCLLFSFLHPAARGARARDRRARRCPDCSISLSSEVLPQIREYYRLSTTVINAYLQPILARYIAQLERRLAEAGVDDAAEIRHAVERRHGDVRGRRAQARSPPCCRARPAASPPAPMPAA